MYDDKQSIVNISSWLWILERVNSLSEFFIHTLIFSTSLYLSSFKSWKALFPNILPRKITVSPLQFSYESWRISVDDPSLKEINILLSLSKHISLPSILILTKIDDFEYCVSVKKNRIFGTQFHPEKSGNIGLEFIKTVINNF